MCPNTGWLDIPRCAKPALTLTWRSFGVARRSLIRRSRMASYHGEFLQRLLTALAAQSGYDELATVPWLPIGESMHLQMVMQIVGSWPDHCIAGVQVKNAFLNPPDVGVPMLLAVGICDEWDQEKKDLLNQWKTVSLPEGIRRERAATPTWPASLLVEGGSGHFECPMTNRRTSGIKPPGLPPTGTNPCPIPVRLI